MYEIISKSPEDTRRLGKLLGQLAEPGDVFCLYGDLGAGKTSFSQGVAEGLGVNEYVTSPTFTLINEYQGHYPFYHMDVYRLSGAGDMADLGYEEYFYGNGVTLVEWADVVSEVLPEERLDLKIINRGEGERILKFYPRGDRYNKVVEELWKIVRAGN
ncbi:tRNA threonylcarbamoyladenosine biosynthesis protein TsaE [Desulfohalotomaculum tongense]|uniref:tRNA (adenosine(37)-N6)-threonylcarbamoyltransferase complex ATPase subunit type 1 TsaE n=1 Tax=Desulforadius tongensis TaxID=1216062 RepID=UPI001956737A|nr:tRNA (adenosine(37)-N6)-threonylcarbamoyltransferase complex ATPase subunit type 1 TsaE [Desulforadius tongensis]MBM7855357.1 tRNA threonylcarbamoyladenosine biosynthesis protein TsaE [Desulforadius tongensis]